MRAGSFIRHKNHRDICYEVKSVHGPYSGYYKFKVIVWNMGYVNSWPLMKDKIKIPKDKLGDYKKLRYEEALQCDCLRYAPWY